MKNKADLIWIIPSIIGALGIVTSALWYLDKLPFNELRLMEWIFQLALVLVVLESSLRFFSKILQELKSE